MIRLLGILTGSAIAVAFLIVTLGIPELAEPEPAVEEHVAPPESLEMMSRPPVVADIEIVVTPDELPDDLSDALPDEIPEPAPITEALPESFEPHWYAFWSPFRSELAANGFVSQLQKTTGLDYRVVRLKPGVYEVAFAYSDDSDIQDKLTQISSATGLDLSGG
ncbi:MAG: hypothetical protein GY949_15855 [Gammaproteobacteria bacterium]|nr:hypothetical protein [Gammaproteobacteria bacterium]